MNTYRHDRELFESVADYKGGCVIASGDSDAAVWVRRKAMTICARCSFTVPEGQVLCPRCYSISGLIGTSDEDRVKPQIIFFLRRGREYRKLTTKHFGKRVGVHFDAGNAEFVDEITRESAGKWRLLVTDLPTATANSETLGKFMAQNPGAQIAIECPAGQLPAGPPLAGTVLYIAPADSDGFVDLMNGLLELIAAPVA